MLIRNKFHIFGIYWKCVKQRQTTHALRRFAFCLDFGLFILVTEIRCSHRIDQQQREQKNNKVDALQSHSVYLKIQFIN